MKYAQLGIVLLVAASLFAACGKKYDHADATASIAPDKITNRTQWASEVQDTGEVEDGWIKDFNDPTLDKLVDEAMAGNPDLAASAARVDQAKALALQAEANLKPTIDMGGKMSRVTRSDWITMPSGVGLGISWEADLWGRLRLKAQSAEASAESVKADYEFGRQSLAASVARAWFLACETRMQLEFLKEVVSLLEQMSGIVEKRNQVGKVSMQDVHQIRAQLATARDAASRAEMAKEGAARSLEVLLGRYPSAEIEGEGKLDTDLRPIPVGMPSSILSRRPDMIAAEDRVAAAFYAQKGTELLHMPRLVLSGAGAISELGNAIAGLNAGLFAPLYTGGKIKSQIDQATAIQKEAVANYAAAAANAFKDVETSLSNEELLGGREKYVAEAAENDRNAYELSQVQYKVGKVDLFEVLELQSRWIGAEMSLLNIRRLVLDNRVNLHLALGGSFETEPEAPAADVAAAGQ